MSGRELFERVKRAGKYALWGLAIVALAFALTRQPSGPLEGAPASAFELPLVGEPGRVAFDPKSGRPMLIEVFASWCGSCRSAAPTLARAHRDSTGSGVEFLGVSVDDRIEAAAGARRDWNIPYPVAFDADGAFASAYNIRALPTFVLIDASGRVRGVSTGAPSRATVRAWVSELGRR